MKTFQIDNQLFYLRNGNLYYYPKNDQSLLYTLHPNQTPPEAAPNEFFSPKLVAPSVYAAEHLNQNTLILIRIGSNGDRQLTAVSSLTNTDEHHQQQPYTSSNIALPPEQMPQTLFYQGEQLICSTDSGDHYRVKNSDQWVIELELYNLEAHSTTPNFTTNEDTFFEIDYQRKVFKLPKEIAQLSDHAKNDENNTTDKEAISETQEEKPYIKIYEDGNIFSILDADNRCYITCKTTDESNDIFYTKLQLPAEKQIQYFSFYTSSPDGFNERLNSVIQTSDGEVFIHYTEVLGFDETDETDAINITSAGEYKVYTNPNLQHLHFTNIKTIITRPITVNFNLLEDFGNIIVSDKTVHAQRFYLLHENGSVLSIQSTFSPNMENWELAPPGTYSDIFPTTVGEQIIFFALAGRSPQQIKFYYSPPLNKKSPFCTFSLPNDLKIQSVYAINTSEQNGVTLFDKCFVLTDHGVQYMEQNFDLIPELDSLNMFIAEITDTSGIFSFLIHKPVLFFDSFLYEALRKIQMLNDAKEAAQNTETNHETAEAPPAKRAKTTESSEKTNLAFNPNTFINTLTKNHPKEILNTIADQYQELIEQGADVQNNPPANPLAFLSM